ncbi:hypothetical protein AAG570_014051 [Ranatra chinensis]|uniref:Uncharacterized protein n=1 Tax=Ranatra chinensis TaxID=642074 RepID=A0ABD0XSA9_9HEMI
MINFVNISKSFKDKAVLSDVNLHIEKGELVSIIGASGCGKTTMLRMINRLLEPTGGKILIKGEEISRTDKIELRRNIGYVIQQTGLFPHMTVQENIEIIPKLQKVGEKELADKTCALMEMIGLSSELLSRYPSELSGGQQQRVGVARAFAIDPEIILMDEPFSALDPITRGSLQDELVNLYAKYGKTVVFVTHDMDEAIKISDRICIMSGGRIIQYGTPEEILRKPADRFVEEFVGKKRLWSSPKYIHASDLMRTNPVVCAETVTLFKCVETMRSEGVDNLMVVDKQQRLIGIIGAKNIMYLQDKSETVGKHMLKDFKCVHPDENISNILKIVDENTDISCVPVVDGSLLGVPLGIAVCFIKPLKNPVLAVVNTVQAIPSIALLGFAIPFFGIGSLPAIIAVTLYSLLPIVRNTVTGISGINPETLEAARGIGLSNRQVLFKVQLPLSLPFIMAGVRISAVTAVGLMTMAAFVGAGGLGYLVFSGIRTVNNYQILAGAIPACILALSVDYLAAAIEKSMVPGRPKKCKKRAVALLLAVLLIFSTSLIMGYKKSGGRVIRIGGKDFTEQSIMVNLIAYMLEDRTDISVERKDNLGGTQVCFGAIIKGDIDMYVEYSGTAYANILKHDMSGDIQGVYNTAKKEFVQRYGLVVLEQMGFNNTYALAVRQDTAEKYDLHTISDLKKYAYTLKLAATLEFMNRQDGLQKLLNAYGLKFKEMIGIDSSPRYIALINKEVDVIDAFTTDSLIKKFNLTVLEDDKNFFPPYYAMPVIRQDALERYPEVVLIMQELGGILTNDIMLDLNYKVDELHMEPDMVAKDFLTERGLIDL